VPEAIDSASMIAAVAGIAHRGEAVARDRVTNRPINYADVSACVGRSRRGGSVTGPAGRP
jgi:hypothetical protein